MKTYIGEECAVCSLHFNEDSDIVCCSDCGAPHHRDCYTANGKCAHTKEHGTDNQWVRTDVIPAQVVPEHKACASCNKAHSASAEKCPHCGYIAPSNLWGNTPPNNTNANISNGTNVGSNPNANSTGQVPPNHSFFSMNDPLGGVAPNAVIDGVPVADVATFIAGNSRKYIPKFIRMGDKKVSWKWPAFLFGGFWFIYRKCYKEGFSILLISLICWTLVLPYYSVALQISEKIPAEATNAEILQIFESNSYLITPTIIGLLVVSLLVSLLTRVFCALYANNIYKRRCLSRIKAIKQRFTGQEYHIFLLTKGGVSLFSVPLFMLLYMYSINILTNLIIF